ncbi:cyclin d [Striga asiatica]|uniref:Cyclin d n=1 Tax=Striga asiatica TaxID=4170 RepID=A0A5A7R5G0_STRAF|nr:cyclin d [Striga asiatica]
MELDVQNPLTSLDDLQNAGVASLFSVESHHAPSPFSFRPSEPRSSLRRTVFSLISRAKLSHDLDPFLVYLAGNYADRFLSEQQIPEKRPWMAHVLVVASLSIAAKTTNADLSVPLSQLQREEDFEVDSRWVHRMEKVLLATLQWRTRYLTPFSFLRCFISISGIDGSRLAHRLEHRASQIILGAQQEFEILVFKPSAIAASAVLCSIHELTPQNFPSSESAIYSCEYLNKDAVLECVGVMQGITRNGGYELGTGATESCTSTPISVLDEQCTSSGSVEGTPSLSDNDV